MSSEEKKSVIEWTIGSEEEFRAVLPKMLKFRKIIMRHLGELMGGRHLFSAFLSGKQAHIRADSFFDAMAAMDFEVIVRPVTGKGTQRVNDLKARTLALRAEQVKLQAQRLAEQAEQAAAS